MDPASPDRLQEYIALSGKAADTWSLGLLSSVLEVFRLRMQNHLLSFILEARA